MGIGPLCAEQFLWQAAAAEPLIELRWHSEVTALSQDGAGGTLRVSTPTEAHDLHAAWVLAADGMRGLNNGLADAENIAWKLA